MRTDFVSFRDGPGGEICRRIGIDISNQGCWTDYTRAMIVFNNQEQGGKLVKRARHFAGVASSGEHVLLTACLYAADFAWLADELSEGGTWRRVDKVSGAYRDAVAACVARIDG